MPRHTSSLRTATNNHPIVAGVIRRTEKDRRRVRMQRSAAKRATK